MSTCYERIDKNLMVDCCERYLTNFVICVAMDILESNQEPRFLAIETGWMSKRHPHGYLLLWCSNNEEFSLVTGLRLLKSTSMNECLLCNLPCSLRLNVGETRCLD